MGGGGGGLILSYFHLLRMGHSIINLNYIKINWESFVKILIIFLKSTNLSWGVNTPISKFYSVVRIRKSSHADPDK